MHPRCTAILPGGRFPRTTYKVKSFWGWGGDSSRQPTPTEAYADESVFLKTLLVWGSCLLACLSSFSASRADSAVVGLEANKTRRNGAPVACSAAAGCGLKAAKPGADFHERGTDRRAFVVAFL